MVLVPGQPFKYRDENVNMMRKFLLTGMVLLAGFSFAQEEENYSWFKIPSEHPDSLKEYEGKIVPVYTADYKRQYERYKRIILKVYPYALYASDVLYNLDEEAEHLEKKRKEKRLYKDAYKGLKDDFKYFLLELYTSEGVMLMKLIHRETDMTVYDIAEKYRGKGRAEMFDLMGKIWDQDVHIKYDPAGEDKIAEHVIKDIENGIINFNGDIVIIDKEQYKTNQKNYRKRKREAKKKNRKRKRECKKDD